MMKKTIISAAILMALSATQVMADSRDDRGKKERRGSSYDIDTEVLEVSCVRVENLKDEEGDDYFEVKLQQLGESGNFGLKRAYPMSEEDAEACELSAETMPFFKSDDSDDSMEEDEAHEVDSDEGHDSDSDSVDSDEGQDSGDEDSGHDSDDLSGDDSGHDSDEGHDSGDEDSGHDSDDLSGDDSGDDCDSGSDQAGA